jgi:hypothetical protein
MYGTKWIYDEQKHPIIVSTRTLALARVKANPFVDLQKQKQKHDHPSIRTVSQVSTLQFHYFIHTV